MSAAEMQPGRKPYTSKIRTLETAETPQWLKLVLFVIVVTHEAAGIIMLIIGIYLYSICSQQPSPFIAGITPIPASMFILLGILAAIFLCTGKEIASIANALFMVILAILMTAIEGGLYSCTRPESENRCTEFRRKFNMCQWAGQFPVVGTSSTAATAEPPIVMTSEDVDTLRIMCLLLAVISMLTSIAMFVIFAAALKLGKPVYLNVLRHTNSIQCGDAGNAMLSYTARMDNLENIKPTEEETEAYNTTRKELIDKYAAGAPESSPPETEPQSSKKKSSQAKKSARKNIVTSSVSKTS